LDHCYGLGRKNICFFSEPTTVKTTYDTATTTDTTAITTAATAITAAPTAITAAPTAITAALSPSLKPPLESPQPLYYYGTTSKNVYLPSKNVQFLR
jgi:hypothetical protein